MEDLFKEHNLALLCIILGSLVFGLPLAWNVLWHLKVGLSNDKVISLLCILISIIYFRWLPIKEVEVSCVSSLSNNKST